MKGTRGSPTAKESAGSVVELFIIVSHVTATCGPFQRRERGKKQEERVEVTDRDR